MKSYWTTATVVLLTAWPSCSKAYVAGLDQALGQAKAGETQQQTQSSTPSSALQTAATAQEPAAAAKPAVIAEPATATTATPAAAAPKSKDSYMLVELSNSLNTKKLKAGDKIKAEVSQDVISHGKIIIPVETQLIGHVTEVSVRDTANPESRLGIVFDKIVLKHYHNIDFQAVVQAVAPPTERRSRVDQPSQMLPPSMMGGESRNNSMGPVSNSSSGGGRSSGGGTSSPVVSTPQSNADMAGVFQTGITVTDSPSTSAASGATVVPVKAPGRSGKSLSVGMPQGVTGLKGLRLATAPSANTPGPVIVSETMDVKLESGTQILLHVMSVEAQK